MYTIDSRGAMGLASLIAIQAKRWSAVSVILFITIRAAVSATQATATSTAPPKQEEEGPFAGAVIDSLSPPFLCLAAFQVSKDSTAI